MHGLDRSFALEGKRKWVKQGHKIYLKPEYCEGKFTERMFNPMNFQSRLSKNLELYF